MTEQEFNELLQSIKNKTYINYELNINIHPFDEDRYAERLNDDNIILLVNALKSNPHITKIDLSGNNVGDTGAVALSSLKTLEELNIADNRVGLNGAIALATASNLKKLILGPNPINYEETEHYYFTKMIDAFVKNNTILNLNFDCCYIQSEMIAQLIAKNTTIKILNLGRYLTDKALEFIKENITLEILYIPESMITDQGAQYIARNTFLKELWVETSLISNVGAKFLSTHLTLQKLYLKDSEITIDGTQFFIDSNLSTIFLEYNLKYDKISEEDMNIFYHTFYESRKVSELLLQQNFQQQNADINDGINAQVQKFEEEKVKVEAMSEGEYFMYLMGSNEYSQHDDF